MIRRWFLRRQLVCREAVALMSDYVDGALDQRDRKRLDAHLADCELCTEYLAQLRATIDALGHAEPEDLSDEALEEFVEQLTWSQLGRHAKPIVLANIEGFWNPLLTLFDKMGGESFIRPGLELNVTVVDRVEKIVPAIEKVLSPFPTASDEQAEAEVSAKF